MPNARPPDRQYTGLWLTGQQREQLAEAVAASGLSHAEIIRIALARANVIRHTPATLAYMPLLANLPVRLPIPPKRGI